MNHCCCCCQVASFVSDSVRPHGLQPTRLLRPWDSPGKNIGVGCHFLIQCMKVESESEVTQSCLTLSDSMDCSLPGSSIHGIFQARVLEWGAIAFSIWITSSPLNQRAPQWAHPSQVINIHFHCQRLSTGGGRRGLWADTAYSGDSGICMPICQFGKRKEHWHLQGYLEDLLVL